MSRIFEALKHAQMVRAGKVEHEIAAQTSAVEVPDRRRSRRWRSTSPCTCTGTGRGRNPFTKKRTRCNVNANGALLLLSVPVRKGQMLLLTNQLTQQEQDCRVVFSGHQAQPDRRGRRGVSTNESRFLALPHRSAAEQNSSRLTLSIRKLKFNALTN